MGFIIMLARAIVYVVVIQSMLIMWIDARLLWWYGDDEVVREGNDVENQHSNKYLYCFDIFNIILCFGYNIDVFTAAASWVIEMYMSC